MPSLLHFKPGAIGEYFDGPVGDRGRAVIKAVHVSTCSHCQTPTEFESMRKMMDHVEICRGCMKLICLKCAGKPCIEYVKKADIDEALFQRKHREWL